MTVAYSRISTATIKDIIIYDPAAERRAARLNGGAGVNWATYFAIGSQEILYALEMSWWPKYVENTLGAFYYQTDSSGRLVTAFSPAKLVTSDQTLKRLEVFKALEIFYGSLVTDEANINEVDRNNFELSRKRYSDEWEKAVTLSNFYDLFGDGTISKLEENRFADASYFGGDRRYF